MEEPVLLQWETRQILEDTCLACHRRCGVRVALNGWFLSVEYRLKTQLESSYVPLCESCIQKFREPSYGFYVNKSPEADKTVFKVGDTVSWTSGGLTKVGTIVMEIPATTSVDDVPGFAEFISPYKLLFGYPSPKKHDSYLVEVLPFGKSRQLRLYYPPVGLLKKVHGK